MDVYVEHFFFGTNSQCFSLNPWDFVFEVMEISFPLNISFCKIRCSMASVWSTTGNTKCYTTSFVSLFVNNAVQSVGQQLVIDSASDRCLCCVRLFDFCRQR